MPLPGKRIGNLRVYVRRDKKEILDFFAADISRKLKEFRDTERRDVLFLTSAGSALSVLDLIDIEVIGPYLTIGIFDECYDPTNQRSNYMALRRTKFFTRAVARGCRLIDTSTKQGQTQEELADYYEQELRTWRARHPRGVIVATMGIARNGHTSGIAPYPDDPKRFHDLFESERWITSYDATGRHIYPKLITTTFTFLRYVDMVGVFLVGKEKGEMFKELLSGDDCAVMPGRIIMTLPRGAVYTDTACAIAAGLIREPSPS
jgi:6-phosphogluconolactonase/glucosamine-6-phosphate isomerase/deaminase